MITKLVDYLKQKKTPKGQSFRSSPDKFKSEVPIKYGNVISRARKLKTGVAGGE